VIERSFAEAESFMDPYESTFDDFNEMVIQVRRRDPAETP
jgi:hypothetical protein